MSPHDNLSKALHVSGRRLTRQRRLVMEVLEGSQEHLDAETLYSQAKARDPNISLATIYRTLAALRDMGLIEEHLLGDNHAHYEAVKDSPHYHFTCVRCGRVIEFDAPQVMQAARAFGKRQGVSVRQVHLLLSGYCAECQDKEAPLAKTRP